MSDSKDLTVTSALVPAVVFGPGGVDDVIDKIRAEVATVDIDIATPSGRRECASLAYKIARSKTALDEMGKELGETHYRAWKGITTERAKIVRELDALRDEVRKPLTDWENRDKARVAALAVAVAEIEAAGTENIPTDSAGIAARIDALRMSDTRDWQEFAKRVEDARIVAVSRLMAARESALKRETEEAEAARLAAEKTELERKAREATVAAAARREAEEKHKREAEALATRVELDRQAAAEKARREREAVEAERIAADARARKAEEDRIATEAKAKADAEAAERRVAAERQAAAEKAERDKQAAIEADRKRVADELAREDAARTAREADRKHRAKINAAARDALIAEGLPEENATAAIAAIARGAVPNVRIVY